MSRRIRDLRRVAVIPQWEFNAAIAKRHAQNLADRLNGDDGWGEVAIPNPDAATRGTRA